MIQQMQAAGTTTLADIAASLNQRRVPTARGGDWHGITVRRLINRSF
jgi:hypothetical protein